MTKHESPLIARWWSRSGISGQLAEEFTIVRRKAPVQVRRLDAIVVIDDDGSSRVVGREQIPDLAGRDVIAVQAKASRLSEGLCGQAIGSIHLVERHHPRSVRSVLICTEDDPYIRPIAEAHGCEVVVVPGPRRSAAPVNPDHDRIRSWARSEGVGVALDVPLIRSSRIVSHAIATRDGEGGPTSLRGCAGRDLQVIVAKKPGKREGTSFGMSPVGYAIVQRRLLLDAGARSVTALILTETVDPVMAQLADRHQIEVATWPAGSV